MTVYLVCLCCACAPESKEHARCSGSVMVMFTDNPSPPYCVLLVQVGHRSFSVHSMFGPMGSRGGLYLFSDLKPNISKRWHLFPCRRKCVLLQFFFCLGPSWQKHGSLNKGAHFQKPLAAYFYFFITNKSKIWHLTSCFTLQKSPSVRLGPFSFLGSL